jgi:phage FluMu protein gp41
MNQDTFELIDGLKPVKDLHRTCTIRTATAGDVIDAQTAAERVVHTADGPLLLVSDSKMGWEMTKRQVVCIGGIEGPLSDEDMRALSGRDLNLIGAKIEALDSAAWKAAQEQAKRGRDEGPGPTD